MVVYKTDEDIKRIETDLEALEKRVAELEAAEGRNPLFEPEVEDFGKTEFASDISTGSDLSGTIILPAASAGSLTFNKITAPVVFQLFDNLWISRDVLFCSARNNERNNINDYLSQYLNLPCFAEAVYYMLCGAYSESHIEGLGIKSVANIQPCLLGKALLPVEFTRASGIRLYNGVPCGYWIADQNTDSYAEFYAITASGNIGSLSAMTVTGAVPAFYVKKD